MQDDLDIDEEMNNDTDFFILVFPSKDDTDFKVICKTRKEIEMSMNEGSSIFYECTGDFVKNRGVATRDKVVGVVDKTPYIKIYGVGGAQIYIDVKEINTMLSSPNRVYYVYFVREITHSTSWNNVYGDQYALDRFVSANHCQDRSNISVYTLKVCEGDCVISNKYVK
jgi:hypothetical protein